MAMLRFVTLQHAAQHTVACMQHSLKLRGSLCLAPTSPQAPHSTSSPSPADPSLANALLMRHGSAVLELLPRNLTDSWLAPLDQALPPLLHWSQDAVHYWSIRWVGEVGCGRGRTLLCWLEGRLACP